MLTALVQGPTKCRGKCDDVGHIGLMLALLPPSGSSIWPAVWQHAWEGSSLCAGTWAVHYSTQLFQVLFSSQNWWNVRSTDVPIGLGCPCVHAFLWCIQSPPVRHTVARNVVADMWGLVGTRPLFAAGNQDSIVPGLIHMQLLHMLLLFEHSESFYFE